MQALNSDFMIDFFGRKYAGIKKVKQILAKGISGG